jgi:hypothetical protein
VPERFLTNRTAYGSHPTKHGTWLAPTSGRFAWLTLRSRCAATREATQRTIVVAVGGLGPGSSLSRSTGRDYPPLTKGATDALGCLSAATEGKEGASSN